MHDEIQAFQENHTWDIMPCPSTVNVKPIARNPVYRVCILVKFKSNGSLDRYKVHGIMLGNHQEYGLNYDETFVLLAMMIIV